MNKAQRDILSRIYDEITQIRDEEQDKLDNIPENLSGSSKADQLQEGIDKLEEISGLLEEIKDGGF